MNIKTLTIKNFRGFKNAHFYIGKYITVISGTNAVGKSTILGLLGNSCEIKPSIGKPILQTAFRCEWSELFKMSPTFDKSKSNVATISYDNEPDLQYRITWQGNKTRGRLIPVTQDLTKKVSNAKRSHPSLYLGLSRLYPLGEAILSDDKKPLAINISDNFLTIYKNILSISDDIQSVNRLYLSDISKSPIGVTTSKYDYLTNSAGQDNLAQILLAIESFNNLKNSLQEKYNGGLLLIDELDAALHPSAQNKLFSYLYDSAKKLDLQIIFTTHSLSLLDYARNISSPMEKSKDTIKPIEIYFLSRANDEDSPTIKRNPDPLLYRNLLLETVSFRSNQKIKIITEDAEARWILSKILSSSMVKNKIKLLDTKIGYNEILSLSKCDPTYFNTRIIILDGDVKTKTATIEDINKRNEQLGYHIFILPDNKSIEQSLYDFLTSNSSSAKKYYKQNICLENGLTLSHFKTLDLKKFKKRSQRERMKAWFNYYKDLFDETNLYDYWEKENQDECQQLLNNIEESVKTISQKLYIPE